LKHRQVDFDRVLIDWADEFIQDLVASFSAVRPTMLLRLAVAGLYLFAALHLIWAALLPFFRDAFATLVGGGASSIPQTQLVAFATGIVVGGISYHLLLAVAYVLLSFVVRATRHWTRAATTAILLVNFAVSLNGLQTPTVAGVLLVFQWISLVLAGVLITLTWAAPGSSSASATASAHAPKRRVFNGRA
jgi:hypothetical protein